MTLSNIARNALRSGYAVEMLRKVGHRVERRTRSEATQWASEAARPLDEFCISLDEVLWHESSVWFTATESWSRIQVSGAGVDLGGGGAAPLLYFLTRYLNAKTVIETGVAAGWSSYAFLSAFSEGAGGHLYSSDFPYFRLREPEQYIGMLVPTDMRSMWTLDLRGDRKAVPEFLDRAGQVDLFHYDSDKSYRGRAWTMRLVRPHLHPGSTVVMDDIQDNLFFRDYVRATGDAYRILEFEGKFVGVVGTFER